ncbi:IS3 family transposase [Streptococcus sp. FSL L8-0526]|uniref:IS3 family transposase n=1 Tax=Streptococcus sp. FSL L8-0526 TaxID=2954690 RepID=UPI004040B700
MPFNSSSFFRINFQSLLKREWINRFKIRDYQQANRLFFEYIEAFYNTKRIHGYCGYMSPNDFESLYEKTKDSRLQLAGKFEDFFLILICTKS